VFEVEAGRVVETGAVDAGGLQEVPLFGAAHRTKIETAADNLKGLDAVISTQYGGPAVEILRERGVIPIEDRGKVHEALRRAADSIYKERADVFE
jgi:nitrogen fixation protein NifB